MSDAVRTRPPRKLPRAFRRWKTGVYFTENESHEDRRPNSWTLRAVPLPLSDSRADKPYVRLPTLPMTRATGRLSARLNIR